MISNTGTETLPRLLREAAVENLGPMLERVSPCDAACSDDGLRVVKLLSEVRKRYMLIPYNLTLTSEEAHG